MLTRRLRARLRAFLSTPTRTVARQKRGFAHLGKALVTLTIGTMLAVGVPAVALAGPDADPIGGSNTQPVVPDGHTLIKVTKGGARLADGTIAGLAGADFSAYQNVGNAKGEFTASCDAPTDDAGVCYIVVPDRDPSGTADDGYWIEETTVPSGWTALPAIATASIGDSTTVAPYTFRTPAVSGVDSITEMPAESVVTTPNVGVWANIVENAGFPDTCGLDIALVVDRSGSIDGEEMAQLRTAVSAFVGDSGLNGTPSRAAVYTFATNASKLVGLTPVGSAELDSALRDATEGEGHNLTNWDAAFRLVAQDAEAYDVVLFLTDGDPTYFDGPMRIGTQPHHIEHAIFSANAVKLIESPLGSHTKVVGVGVGMNLYSMLNLQAISGPTHGEDYYLATDFEALSERLNEIATKSCGGTVTVQKKVVDQTGGIIEDDVAGWQFDAAAASIVNESSQTTNTDGYVNFALDFSGAKTQDVTITEVQRDGYRLAQQDGRNATCTADGEPRPVTDSGALGFTVVANVHEVVSCVVTNTAPPKDASVKVDKQWVINGVAQPVNSIPDGFETQLLLGGALDSTFGSVYSGYAAGQEVTVTETYTTPDRCSPITSAVNGEAFDVESGYVAHLVEGANAYLITNTITCQAELTLVKDVINDDGGVAVATDWNAKLYAGDVAFDNTETKYLAPGSYELVEEQLSGYELLHVQCDGGLFDEATRTLALTWSDTVTCTFTNDDIAPTLTLIKQVVGDTDATADNWTLSADGSSGSMVIGHGSVGPLKVKAGETFTLSEVAAHYGDEFVAGGWHCDAGIAVRGVGAEAVTLTPIALGQNVTCTITNTAEAGEVEHSKRVRSVTPLADGSWDLIYDVTVTNTSDVNASTYSLTDTFRFGPDVAITPGTVKATNTVGIDTSAWTGSTPNTTLAPDGTWIAAGATHKYTITVNAVLTRDAGTTSRECRASAETSAFANVATLNGSNDVLACAEPTFPTVHKIPGTATAVEGEDGQWDVTYTIGVLNPRKRALFFDLADTPIVPAGVTVVGTPQIIPVSPAPDAVTGVLLPPGTAYTYNVTVRVQLSSDVSADDLACGSDGHGIKNVATVTSGNQTFSDDACVSVPVPKIQHEKTVYRVAQQPDGRWSIGYRIVVSNLSDVPGIYSLSDTTAFGSGMHYEHIDASVGGPGASATWNGLDDVVIASDVAIPPQGQNVYTIRIVNVDVAASAIEDAEVEACPVQDPTDTGGFNNIAVLRVMSVDVVDTACAQPTAPSIQKEFVSAVHDPSTGTWDASYTLTVDNTFAGSRHAFYALSDSIGFADGVDVNSWTVIGQGRTLTGPFTDGVIVPIDDQVQILAGDAHVYEVVFNVGVSAGISNTTCTTSPKHGFFNSATLTSGNDQFNDSGCGPITDGGVPSLSKVVDSSTQNHDGSWRIVYDVVVAGNPTYTTSYSLTDMLDFGNGITVTSAGWTGPTSGSWADVKGPQELARDATITAGDTHTYTVTVDAVVAEDAFEREPAALLCLPGQSVWDGTGFLNRATLTSGSTPPQRAEACAEPAAPEITKIVSTPPTQDGDEWSIEYQVLVRNTSAHQALVYSLDDNLVFGPAARITSAVATLDGDRIEDWNGTEDTRLAENVVLQGGSSHRYTITATFVIDPTDDVSLFTCETSIVRPGSGLFNVASVTSGSDRRHAVACADIPVTLIVDKIWQINGEAIPVGDAPDWIQDAAQLILDGQKADWGTEYAPFDAGDTVTIDERVDDLPDSCTLGAPEGLDTVALTESHNRVTVTNHVDCEANVKITKDHISSTQQTDGTWNLVYTLTVSGDSPVIDLHYDLTDTLEHFGDGIVINRAVWSGPTGSGTFNGETATLATAETLEGGSGPDVYTVSVNATVTQEAWARAAASCETSDNGFAAGGFRNVATVTVSGRDPVTATDCDEPNRPEITKSVTGAAELQDDGNWRIVYSVDVTNDHEIPLVYDLADSLAFPNGVTIVDATATNDAAVDTSGWTGSPSGETLTTAQPIAPHTTHTYTITVIAAVTQEVANGDLLCTDDGGGFRNTARLWSGTVSTDVDACTDIPMATLTLVKRVDNTPFDGLDLHDKTVAQPSDWLLTATSDRSSIEVPGSETGTTRVVPIGEYTLSETTKDAANPLSRYYREGNWSCSTADGPVDAVTVIAGEVVTCTITNTAQPVDLWLDKTDGGIAEDGPAVPTDVNAEFEYHFAIGNNSQEGTPAARNVIATDEIPTTIAVIGWSDVPGWTVGLHGEDPHGFGGTLTFTTELPFGPGEEVTFTVRVKTADDLPREGGDSSARILDIVNTATVTSDGIEKFPGDNTSTVNTPVKSIMVSTTAICRADAPWVTYAITPFNMEKIETGNLVLIWWSENAYEDRDPTIPADDTGAILADGAYRVDSIDVPSEWSAGDPISGDVLWPGASVDGTGQGTGWPGWSKLPNGQWALDSSSPTYEIRGNAVVEVRMNPTTASVETYPPATLDCSAAPPSRVPVTGFESGWIAVIGGGLLFSGAMFLIAFWVRRRGVERGE